MKTCLTSCFKGCTIFKFKIHWIIIDTQSTSQKLNISKDIYKDKTQYQMYFTGARAHWRSWKTDVL